MLSPEDELIATAVDRLDDGASPFDPKAIVGEEVRFWRNERGLTGDELAEMSGVSASMPTQVTEEARALNSPGVVQDLFEWSSTDSSALAMSKLKARPSRGCRSGGRFRNR